MILQKNKTYNKKARILLLYELFIIIHFASLYQKQAIQGNALYGFDLLFDFTEVISPQVQAQSFPSTEDRIC